MDRIIRPKHHKLQNRAGLISDRWPDLFNPLSHDKHMGCFRLVLQLLSSVSSVSPLWQSRLTMLTLAAWAACGASVQLCNASLISVAQFNGFSAGASRKTGDCVWHRAEQCLTLQRNRLFFTLQGFTLQGFMAVLSRPENAKWCEVHLRDTIGHACKLLRAARQFRLSDSCGQTWDLDSARVIDLPRCNFTVCKLFARRSHWRRWHLSHVPICKGLQGCEMWHFWIFLPGFVAF